MKLLRHVPTLGLTRSKEIKPINEKVFLTTSSDEAPQRQEESQNAFSPTSMCVLT